MIIKSSTTIQSRSILQSPRGPIPFTMPMHLSSTNKSQIIGEMFFYPNEQDGITRARALNLFNAEPDNPNVYSVTIKYPMQFSLIVSWLARGVSFRQAQDMFLSTQRITGVVELGAINDTGVSNYVRVVCAINLGKLSTILNNKSM
jgi:hypothetical protein